MAAIVHGGGLTAAIARFGGRAEDWLDLSTGINPNPPALPEIPLSVWNRLPDKGLEMRAREAAAKWYLGSEGSSARPVAVPGTQAFIQLLPKLTDPLRRAAIISPTYGEYAHCLISAGIAVDAVSGLDQVSEAHNLVVVVNPNNPDGRTHSPNALLALAGQLADRGAHLHVDEAFGDMRADLSVAGFATELSNLTVSRSFGKFFGLAGVRLGFIFGSTMLVARLEEALGPWAVSGPALFLAQALMNGGRDKIEQDIRQRHSGLLWAIAQGGLSPSGGTELFQLIKVENAAALVEHLGRCHILVRKFDYDPSWIRIGLAPDETGDRRLAEALAAFDG